MLLNITIEFRETFSYLLIEYLRLGCLRQTKSKKSQIQIFLGESTSYLLVHPLVP